MIGEQDEDDRDRERDLGEDGATAQQSADTQARLQLLDIGVQVVPSGHGSSLDMVRY